MNLYLGPQISDDSSLFGKVFSGQHWRRATLYDEHRMDFYLGEVIGEQIPENSHYLMSRRTF